MPLLLPLFASVRLTGRVVVCGVPQPSRQDKDVAVGVLYCQLVAAAVQRLSALDMDKARYDHLQTRLDVADWRLPGRLCWGRHVSEFLSRVCLCCAGLCRAVLPRAVLVLVGSCEGDSTQTHEAACWAMRQVRTHAIPLTIPGVMHTYPGHDRWLEGPVLEKMGLSGVFLQADMSGYLLCR